MQRGYVYILFSSASPNLVKIGYTARSPEERARELSGDTGVPLPYTVAWQEELLYFEEAEGEIHTRLERFRVNARREFFAVPLKDAIQVVREVAEKYRQQEQAEAAARAAAQVEQELSQGRLSPAPAPPPAPAPVPQAPAPPLQGAALPLGAAGALPRGAQPRLLVLRGQKRNVEYPIYEGLNFIGRADEKPVDIDLVGQEPPDRIWCSRQHACISFENDQLAIEDLNSANGTYVNRVRIYAGQKRSLAVNDIIQIGTVQMKVVVPGPGHDLQPTRELEPLLQAGAVRKPPESNPRPDAAAAARVERSAQRIRQAHTELTNSIGMQFVLLPAGKFLMGSLDTEEERRALFFGAADERPREAEVVQACEAMYGPLKWPADEHQHEVEITRPFYLGVHQVTVGNFRVFCQRAGYKTEAEKVGVALRWTGSSLAPHPRTDWQNPGGEQTDDHPVTCVTWSDAQAFCNWISGIKNEHWYRLPTEAEWEYACRAGTTTPFFFGKAGKAEEYAWFKDNSGMGPHPVGTKRPNAWGLFDMQGNVWEWCEDWYDESYYAESPRHDPRGPIFGASRVARGASFICDRAGCRSAGRHRGRPGECGVNLGFRVVCYVSGKLT
jgi:formylglycine-generating enzyme required for sulfatase activity